VNSRGEEEHRIDLNYLWLVFPAGASNQVPAVRELEVNPMGSR